MKVEFFSGANSSSVNPKVYHSVIDQSGTNTPTEVNLRNDFGSDMSFTWQRNGVGKYRAVGIYNFFSPNITDKTIVFTTNIKEKKSMCVSFSALNLSILKDFTFEYETIGGSNTDSFNQVVFEIRLYQ